MKRKNIGILEIDEMIEGGLPQGSVVGISGSPGVGKSIFALHFLLGGARNGEKSVYINLEEPRRNIDNMIKGFDFSKEFFEYEKKGLIIIKCFNYSEYEKISFDLLEKVKEDDKIERLVIDSFNCFFDSLEKNCGEGDYLGARRMINSSFSYFRKESLNTLLILEKHENTLINLDYNIPYLVDGIIKLDYLDLGVIERRIIIPKMRWTNQHKESKFYEINSEGIKILSENQI